LAAAASVAAKTPARMKGDKDLWKSVTLMDVSIQST